MALLLTFFPLCFVVAFVCTAVKETDRSRIISGTGRLFTTIVGGILGFAIVVESLTLLLQT